MEPVLVGACGAAAVAVGCVAAQTEVPKLPLESADGDDAESMSWRLRERVAGPDGDDGVVSPAGHPPGGGWLRLRPPFVLLHGGSRVCVCLLLEKVPFFRIHFF